MQLRAHGRQVGTTACAVRGWKPLCAQPRAYGLLAGTSLCPVESAHAVTRHRPVGTPFVGVEDALHESQHLPGLLFITSSRSLLKLMSMEWVMPINNLILCGPLLFLPSILPRIEYRGSESSVPS